MSRLQSCEVLVKRRRTDDDDADVNDDDIGGGRLRLPEVITTLAAEGRVLKWSEALGAFLVLDGAGFEKRFNELRYTRNKMMPTSAQYRPFSRMHSFFVLIRGEKWAGTGSAFKFKNADAPSAAKPIASISASSVNVQVSMPGNAQPVTMTLQNYLDSIGASEMYQYSLDRQGLPHSYCHNAGSPRSIPKQSPNEDEHRLRMQDATKKAEIDGIKKLKNQHTKELLKSLDLLLPHTARCDELAAKNAAKNSKRSEGRSGRTATDVLEDAVQYIRHCKQRVHVPQSATNMLHNYVGSGVAGREPTRMGGAARLPQVQVSHQVHDDAMTLGLLLSSQLWLLEVEISGLIVVRLSAAMHALFQYHPRDNSVIGECLLHYVDLPSAKTLRAAVQSANAQGTRLSPPTPSSRSTSTFEITLRTWQHASGVSERAFSVERIRATSGHKELWMLSPVDEPVGDTRVPAPGTSDSGWTVEKMREVTGAYTEDLERSSQPFWRTVDRTQAIAQQKGSGSYPTLVTIGLRAFQNIESTKIVMKAIGTPQGCTHTTDSIYGAAWAGLKNLMTKMYQSHCTFDMNDEVPVLHMHTRLQLPKLAGALRTPWVKLCSAQLNGRPVPAMTTKSKEVRMYALPSAVGQLRVLFFVSVKFPEEQRAQEGCSMQCYHTREFDFRVSEGNCFVVHGELFRSADEPPHTFQHRFAKEEEGTYDAATMALQSSLLLDPYLEEAPAARHSSLLFDPYLQEPPAGSAGSKKNR